MKLVAVMMVGNEADLVEATIRNTLSLGVDAFVITDMASEDGTAAILARYATDPRFDIQFLSHAQIYGRDCIRPVEIGKGMLRRAREVFGADWILRQDADEFWCAGPRPLRDILHEVTADQVSVRRYNAVTPRDGAQPAALINEGRLAEVLVMRHPFPSGGIRSGATARLPVNFAQIQPRPIVRASRADHFGPGAHSLRDGDGNPLTTVETNAIAIVHLWFTTLDRFARKSAFIHAIRGSIRPAASPGWQWNRWGDMADTRKDEILHEFQAQFPTPGQLDLLQRQGRVSAAASLSDPADPAPTGDQRIKADLAELGWLD